MIGRSSLNSLRKSSAPAKLVAVCPEGNDCVLNDGCGLNSFTFLFNVSVMATCMPSHIAIIANHVLNRCWRLLAVAFNNKASRKGAHFK